MIRGAVVSEQRRGDLLAQAEWWWDEAARCARLGMERLAEFCRTEAARLRDEATA